MRDHIARTLRLAFPVMLARAGILIMIAVDTAMVGHYAADDLAHYGLGLAPQVVMIMTGIGLLLGTMVLTAQADGAGDARACGGIWRLGLVKGAIYGVVVMFVCQAGGRFYVVLGQPADLASGGGEVMVMLGWGIPALFMHAATSFFLEGIHRPIPGMVVMLGANLINLLLNWIFIFGHFGAPELGAEGAALATSIVRWLMFVVLATYVVCMRDHARFGLRGRIAEKAQLAIRLLRIGAPLAVTHGIEASAFATLTILAGFLGTIPLGGFQVAMNLVAIVFMCALGFSTAASVRVGNAVGRRDRDGARRAGWTATALVVIVMTVFGAVFLLFPNELASVYTNDPAVRRIAAPTIVVAALVLVVDGAQGVLIGALRGAADTMVPAFAYLLSLWGLLVPLAYHMAVDQGGGAPALMVALSIALTVLAGLLVARFTRVMKHLPMPA